MVQNNTFVLNFKYTSLDLIYIVDKGGFIKELFVVELRRADWSGEADDPPILFGGYKKRISRYLAKFS